MPEHHDASEIIELMAIASERLRPGGRLLALLPSGASPFSRAPRHGDATHRSTLTPGPDAQVGASAGLRPVWPGNAARDRALRGPASLLALAFAPRDLERALGPVHFGQRVPLDPNATVVPERPMS